jgi:hypothetical protein
MLLIVTDGFPQGDEFELFDFGGAFVFSTRRQKDVNNVQAALVAQFKLHLDSLRLRPGD